MKNGGTGKVDNPIQSGGKDYSAGQGIDISGNQISLDSNNVSQFTNDSQYITAAQYPTTNIVPKGVAMTATNPVGAVAGWLYIAGESGLFANFSNLTAAAGDGLLYNGTAWQIIPHSMLEQGKNLYNPSTRNINFFVNHTTGTLSGNSSYDTTDYIPVVAGQQYTRTSKLLDRVAYYNASKVYVSGVYPGGATLTIPVGVSFIRIAIYKPSINPVTEFQFEDGAAETFFQAYGFYLKKSLLPASWVPGTSVAIGSLPYDRTDFMAIGKNKYDKSATGIQDGYRIKNDGTSDVLGTESASDYFSVKSSQQYVFNQYVSGLAFYDINKVFIAGSFTGNATNPVVTSPATAKYCRASFDKRLKDFFQVEEGAVSSLYERFEIQFNAPVGFSNNLNYQDLGRMASVDILLPGTIYVTAGHEKTMYLENIIRSNLPLSAFNINVSSTLDRGKFYKGDVVTVNTSAYNLGPYYQWPTGDPNFSVINADAGTYTFTIAVYLGNVLVSSKTVGLVATATSAGNGITRKVVFAGESTTKTGTYPQETRALFGPDVMDISLVGSVEFPAGQVPPVKHEGYDGFTWLMHNTNAGSNIVNGGVIDMNNYESTYSLGLQANDWLICLGFINDVAGQDPLTDYSGVTTRLELYMTQLEVFYAAYRAKYGSIRVGICTPICPPMGDAWGKGVSGRQGQSGDNALLRMQMLARKIIDKYDTPAYQAQGIFVIDVMSGMDRVFGYPFLTNTPINYRNPGITRRIIEDRLHPATVGYYQVADIMYDFLKAKA